MVNKDPDIWGSDADEWKPERWLALLPNSVIEAKVPGVFSHMFVVFPCVGSMIIDSVDLG